MSLVSIMQALAAQIQDGLCGTASPQPIENLQVTSIWNPDPTPPSIDVYPTPDTFQESIAYGNANNDMRLTVRARVTKADPEAGQLLLYAMMDPSAETSVAKIIGADRQLGTACSSLVVENLSGLGEFRDAGGQGSLLGCTWTVRIIP